MDEPAQAGACILRGGRRRQRLFPGSTWLVGRPQGRRYDRHAL